MGVLKVSQDAWYVGTTKVPEWVEESLRVNHLKLSFKDLDNQASKILRDLITSSTLFKRHKHYCSKNVKKDSIKVDSEVYIAADSSLEPKWAVCVEHEDGYWGESFGSSTHDLEKSLVIEYRPEDSRMEIACEDLAKNFLAELEKLDEIRRKEKGVVKVVRKVTPNSFLFKRTVYPAHAFIPENYNPEIKDGFKELLEFCKTEKNGLALLHGSPGTGKTWVLRNLISELTEENNVFMATPQQVEGFINNPDYLEDLCKNGPAILIVEEAEKLLVSRESSFNMSTATIINLTDGLLDGTTPLKIICTFNTEKSKLDKALLRKGRLKCNLEFKKLSKSRAQLVADRLGKELPTDQEEFTLAEIYIQKDLKFDNKETKKIGFD